MADRKREGDRTDEPPPLAGPTSRIGARAVLAAVALALVALPGALTLLLVEDRWPPLGAQTTRT